MKLAANGATALPALVCLTLPFLAGILCSSS